MKNQPWVNLALFENKLDAEALQIYLNHQGFVARAHNDRFLQLILFLCPPRAMYRVQVRRDHHEAALEFLHHQVASTMILKRALTCPSCASKDVQYPQMTRKFFTPTLLLHLGIIFRIIDHEAYCEHCHFVWHLPKDRTLVHNEPAMAHK
jgi:hypothetical protein